MNTCYIYIYLYFLSLRKRDHQGNLLAYIQCFCFRYAKWNSIELLTHICWSFRKYMKKVFRRKSTITEFKIERNRILSLLSFPTSIFDAPHRFIPYILAGFCETQVYKSGWTLQQFVDALNYRIFRRGEMVHSIKNKKKTNQS